MQEMKLLAGLFAIGAVTSVAKMLVNNDPLHPKLLVGRAIVGGVTGLAAGAMLSVIPGLNVVALIGIASVLASLGTSGIELLANRLLKK